MKTFCLRLSPDLYEILQQCRALSRRSMQMEIVVLIERGIEAVAEEETKRRNGGARKPRRKGVNPPQE